MNTMMQRIEPNIENTMNTMMQRIELFDTNVHLVGNSSDSDTESESETLNIRDDNDSFSFVTVTPPRGQNLRKRRSCTGRIEGSAFRPMVPPPKRLCRSPKVFSQGNLSKWQENLQPAKEVTATSLEDTTELFRMESWWFKARRGESFDGNRSGSGSNFWDEVDEMVGDSKRDATALLVDTKMVGNSERYATALLNEDYEHYIANISACSY